MATEGPNDLLELNGLLDAYSDVASDESAYAHREAIVWLQWIVKSGTTPVVDGSINI